MLHIHLKQFRVLVVIGTLFFFVDCAGRVKSWKFYDSQSLEVRVLNTRDWLDGVKDVVQASNKRPGIDYNLVTLSFNSKDSFESSKIFENKYSSILNADESWNFYTSDDISIQKITKSVGFKFQPDGDEFAHPAGIILLTNDGIVSRYLSGVIYDPRDFKLAIIEASQGSTGTVSLSDKVLLYCFDFDPVGKKYALRALNVMKLGGAITLFAIIIMMGFLWLRKNKGEQ